jgi:ligand-binding SRPBCC domain-containing protein
MTVKPGRQHAGVYLLLDSSAYHASTGSVAHIHLETFVGAPIETVFDLARDIDFHQRSMAGTGEQAVDGRTSGLIGAGESVTWRARHFRLAWSMTSRITAYDRPARFVDEQVSGPFASFRHEHRFEVVPGGTLMIDDWQHSAPFGPLGRLVDALVLRRHMTGLLRQRNSAFAREAATAGVA